MIYIDNPTISRFGPSLRTELEEAGIQFTSFGVTSRRRDKRGQISKGNPMAFFIDCPDDQVDLVHEVLDAHDPDVGLLEDVDRAVEEVAEREAESRLSNRAYLRKLREAIEVLTPKSGAKSDAVLAILDELQQADEPLERAVIVKQDVRADPSKRRDLPALFREPRPE